jgi:hypothetical protein
MVRQLPRVKILENHLLSNGDHARVTVYKRSYSFDIIYREDQCPHVENGLTKDQAYGKLADSIRNDVLEMD